MKWSNNFAYAVGLITTDGNLSKDGRHISICSKDLEQIINFQSALKISNKITRKGGAYVTNKIYYLCQFSNVKLYNVLLKIGLMPNKSKILKVIKIPDRYFSDFLRGIFDGDGYTHSYFDKRWNNSFLLYTGFVSASKDFLTWIQDKIYILYRCKGSIVTAGGTAFQLRYSKFASINLIKIMYIKKNSIYLSRKKYKIDQSLSIIRKQIAGML